MGYMLIVDCGANKKTVFRLEGPKMAKSTSGPLINFNEEWD